MNSTPLSPLYDDIGEGYDTTRKADPYLVDRFAFHLHLRDGASYLDVACGTGNYTTALAARGGRWHAIDHSARMIAIARRKSGAIAWYQTEAAALPFPDGSFAGAVCTLAIHHFKDLVLVFREVHRVLAAGVFVFFTSTPDQMRHYWLNRYFPEALQRAIQQMPSREMVHDALSKAGFSVVQTEPYYVTPNLQDCFLYAGKHRPELYLSAAVRRGISTFAALADAAEVARGCTQLRADIESGRITAVIAASENEKGDYLFAIATKRDSALDG